MIKMEEPQKQDQTLNVFKTISGFVKNMNECYGTTQKTLQLYARLITKTTLEDDGPIKRHIEAFRKFCVNNESAIMEKNHKGLVDVKISYNEKVYINMQHIFNTASAGERTIIWKHILTIYAFINPQSKAKEMLKDVLEKDGKGGKEQEFLTDIFDKVGNNIQPDGNPLQAVGNLMSSGIFTDIVGSMSNGLESGELDLGRLMGSMQGMVTNISSMAGENSQQPPEMTEMLGQMTAMMGNLDKMTQQSNANVTKEDLDRGADLATNMIRTQSGMGSDTGPKMVQVPNIEDVEENIRKGLVIEEIDEQPLVTESLTKDSHATEESVLSGSESSIPVSVQAVSEDRSTRVNETTNSREVKSSKSEGKRRRRKEKKRDSADV
jgi:hypothetical protein